MLEPTVVMSSVKTEQGTSVTPLETKGEKINQTVRTYQNYIDEKIKKLNPSDSEYKEKKENLENCKKRAEPKEENFDSFEDFQKSTFYKGMSKDDQNSYSKDNFPKKLKTVTLSFDNLEEAANYLNKNMGAPTARKFLETAHEKGLKIDPKVLDEFSPKNENSVSSTPKLTR